MSNTFRLMKAEFKKIFKNPGVYILALLLVGAILSSLFLFNPEKINDKNISYSNANTAKEYYDNFNNSDLPYSLNSINVNFDSTNKTIDYFRNSYNRFNALSVNYNKLLFTIDELSKEENLKNNDFKTNIKTACENYIGVYDNFNGLEEINYIVTVIDNIPTSEKSVAKDIIKSCNDPNITPQDILNIYNTNNYEEHLNTEYLKAQNFIITALDNLSTVVIDSYANFNKSLASAHNLPSIKENAIKLKNSIIEYINYVKILSQSNYVVTINESKFKYLSYVCDASIDELDEKTEYYQYISARDKIANFSLQSNVLDFRKYITQIFYKNDFITDLNKISQKVKENQNIIIEKIDNSSNDKTIKNISFYISEYYYLINSYTNLVKDKFLLNLINENKGLDFNQLLGKSYKDLNVYKIKEDISLSNYYINNNIYENSFINNFSFNQETYDDTTVYDYVYYAMQFCNIIIIVFSVMMISNIITAETESGTIKLLLVRPYKRSKIITAKLFATLSISFIFLLFSFITTFIAGYFMFGIINANIVAVFNSSYVFQINPLLMMLISFLSFMFDIFFYVSLALMISIIFKNYATSITFDIIVFIAMFILNIFCGNMFWYSFLPPMNLNLFKFFGNSFLVYNNSSLLYKLFQLPILDSMSFIFSGIISISYITIFLLISYLVFNKRDF